MKLQVLVIGLGSMGRRRIRLIQQYSKDIFILGIDSQVTRCEQAENEYGIKTVGTLEDALNKNIYDCAFVSTSPLSHALIIEKCLKAGIHVFTEINLVSDGYTKNLNIANQNGKTLFLSSTFLYRKEVKHIQKQLNNYEGKLLYRYHVGQYLPDWHPWENYKDFFVSDKRSNGCRELFAIEFPWLIKVFGKITNVKVEKGNISSLDLNYPDYFMVMIEHESGHKGTLCIDLLCRKAVREFEVFGELVFIKWDGSPYGLEELDFDKKQFKLVNLYENIDKLNNYSDNIIENAYFDEVKNFFNVVLGKEKAEYSFEQDLEVLSLIDRIEEE